MSRLAGLFYFDRRPIAAADRANVRRALDGAPRAEFCGCGWLMAQEDSANLQPVSPRAKQVENRNAGMLDGRLDNGEELWRKYRNLLNPAYLDGDLAVTVYERQGIPGLRSLIGDWSLVLWDNALSSIVLASDYAGIRPLYYACTEDRVIWASSLARLVEWVDAAELDDRYVAGLLGCGSGRHHTPYRQIEAVPPGYSLHISKRRFNRAAFWKLPLTEVTECACEGEYEERLRGLLTEAVRVRMRTPRPVFAELSGGLDSSSVVCIANRLTSDCAVSAKEVIPLNYGDNSSGDEGFVQHVEQHCGLSSLQLQLGEFPLMTSGLVGGAMPMLWEPRMRQVSAMMARSGSDVLLTGQLGDLVMGNWLDDSEQVGDHLAKRQFGKALREAFEWSRFLRTPVYSILWRASREALGAGSAGISGDLSQNDAENAYGNSLSPHLQERLRETDENGLAWLREAPPSRRKRLAALHEIFSGRGLQCPEPLNRMPWAHPFAHRPLVEFMMSVPPGIVCRPGVSRRLMRRALTGLVPGAILRRSSKGTYQSFFLSSLRPLAAELLRSRKPLELVERGYLERTSIENRLKRLSQGLPCNEPQLRFVLLLEFWLRRRRELAPEPGLPAEIFAEA